MKQIVRINENQLNKIVLESVKRILKEDMSARIYKGVYIPDILNFSAWTPHVDAALKDGWSVEKIQDVIGKIAMEKLEMDREERNSIRRFNEKQLKEGQINEYPYPSSFRGVKLTQKDIDFILSHYPKDSMLYIKAKYPNLTDKECSDIINSNK